MRLAALALVIFPTVGLADGLMVKNAMVPVAPPSAKAHAAYMELHNHGDALKALIGVTAEGYAMAHLHVSEEKDGVATMSAVSQIDIAPEQSVALMPGGLHIMLMRPSAPVAEGDTVAITLEFADGSTQAVTARVMKRDHAMHADHSGHKHGS